MYKKGLIASLEQSQLPDIETDNEVEIDDSTNEESTALITELKDTEVSIEEVTNDIITLQNISNIVSSNPKPDTTTMQLSQIAIESICIKLGLDTTNIATESYNSVTTISVEGISETLQNIFQALLRVIKWFKDKLLDMWKFHSTNVLQLSQKQTKLTQAVAKLDARGKVKHVELLDSPTLDKLSMDLGYTNRTSVLDITDILRNTTSLLSVGVVVNNNLNKAINTIKDSLSDPVKLAGTMSGVNNQYRHNFKQILHTVKDYPYEGELGPLYQHKYFAANEHIVKHEGVDASIKGHDVYSMKLSVIDKPKPMVAVLDTLDLLSIKSILTETGLLIKELNDYKKIESTTRATSAKMEGMITSVMHTYSTLASANQANKPMEIDYATSAQLFRDINSNLSSTVFSVLDLGYSTVSAVHRYLAMNINNWENPTKS